MYTFVLFRPEKAGKKHEKTYLPDFLFKSKFPHKGVKQPQLHHQIKKHGPWKICHETNFLASPGLFVCFRFQLLTRFLGQQKGCETLGIIKGHQCNLFNLHHSKPFFPTSHTVDASEIYPASTSWTLVVSSHSLSINRHILRLLGCPITSEPNSI